MQTVLPRWRGFNLTYFFSHDRVHPVLEDDFRWMADWGFDFARIPMSYRLWTDPTAAPYTMDEAVLAQVDRVVELGRQYGIHINLNLHRAPGYCVNRGVEEPFDLWKGPEALGVFCYQWEQFARRYTGIPSSQLSFDLVNEPPAPGAAMTREDYARVMRMATATIRAVDPARLVIVDGLDYGNAVVPELADLGVAQSCRAYVPMGISHYMASWVQGEEFPAPAWPGGWSYGRYMDRADLEAHYQPWFDLAAQGVGVHCGEGGAFNRTPHPVFLAWFRDVLDILTAQNVGYALWNFRGAFGILDSGRADVAYEDWYGHKLDRKLLELLQAF